VIDVATLSVIRRWALRERLSIREIARRTGLSRNTIRKYLRSDDKEPSYAKRESVSQLDPFADKLAQWLKTEASKNRKQRRTLKQMHAELMELGFDGSYNRVAAFARDWALKRQEEQKTTGRGTFVPLVFEPGEAFQFDWSEDWAVLGGERTKLQVAHFKLSHSRAFYIRAYLLQTHEMLFDAHNHAFRVFGGVPKRGIYDNMKTAVDKVLTGKARDVNARFTAMVSHYLFEVEFCNPASGWEKGQIEKNVRDARHRLWQPVPAFPSLDALNVWLEERCKALWSEISHGKLPGTLHDAWQDERRLLMPLPRPFDGFIEHAKRLADLPHHLRTHPLQRAGLVREPAGEPARVRRPAGRCGRGQDHLRAPAGDRAAARHHRPDDLRLAPLPGGAAAQARCAAQRRAVRRAAAGLQAAAGRAAEEARR